MSNDEELQLCVSVRVFKANNNSSNTNNSNNNSYNNNNNKNSYKQPQNSNNSSSSSSSHSSFALFVSGKAAACEAQLKQEVERQLRVGPNGFKLQLPLPEHASSSKCGAFQAGIDLTPARLLEASLWTGNRLQVNVILLDGAVEGVEKSSNEDEVALPSQEVVETLPPLASYGEAEDVARAAVRLQRRWRCCRLRRRSEQLEKATTTFEFVMRGRGCRLFNLGPLLDRLHAGGGGSGSSSRSHFAYTAASSSSSTFSSSSSSSSVPGSLGGQLLVGASASSSSRAAATAQQQQQQSHHHQRQQQKQHKQQKQNQKQKSQRPTDLSVRAAVAFATCKAAPDWLKVSGMPDTSEVFRWLEENLVDFALASALPMLQGLQRLDYRDLSRALPIAKELARAFIQRLARAMPWGEQERFVSKVLQTLQQGAAEGCWHYRHLNHSSSNRMVALTLYSEVLSYLLNSADAAIQALENRRRDEKLASSFEELPYPPHVHRALTFLRPRPSAERVWLATLRRSGRPSLTSPLVPGQQLWGLIRSSCLANDLPSCRLYLDGSLEPARLEWTAAELQARGTRLCFDVCEYSFEDDPLMAALMKVARAIHQNFKVDQDNCLVYFTRPTGEPDVLILPEDASEEELQYFHFFDGSERKLTTIHCGFEDIVKTLANVSEQQELLVERSVEVDKVLNSFISLRESVQDCIKSQVSWKGMTQAWNSLGFSRIRSDETQSNPSSASRSSESPWSDFAAERVQAGSVVSSEDEALPVPTSPPQASLPLPPTSTYCCPTTAAAEAVPRAILSFTTTTTTTTSTTTAKMKSSTAAASTTAPPPSSRAAFSFMDGGISSDNNIGPTTTTIGIGTGGPGGGIQGPCVGDGSGTGGTGGSGSGEVSTPVPASRGGGSLTGVRAPRTGIAIVGHPSAPNIGRGIALPQFGRPPATTDWEAGSASTATTASRPPPVPCRVASGADFFGQIGGGSTGSARPGGGGGLSISAAVAVGAAARSNDEGANNSSPAAVSPLDGESDDSDVLSNYDASEDGSSRNCASPRSSRSSLSSREAFEGDAMMSQISLQSAGEGEGTQWLNSFHQLSKWASNWFPATSSSSGPEGTASEEPAADPVPELEKPDWQEEWQLRARAMGPEFVRPMVVSAVACTARALSTTTKSQFVVREVLDVVNHQVRVAPQAHQCGGSGLGAVVGAMAGAAVGAPAGPLAATGGALAGSVAVNQLAFLLDAPQIFDLTKEKSFLLAPSGYDGKLRLSHKETIAPPSLEIALFMLLAQASLRGGLNLAAVAKGEMKSSDMIRQLAKDVANGCVTLGTCQGIATLSRFGAAHCGGILQKACLAVLHNPSPLAFALVSGGTLLLQHLLAGQNGSELAATDAALGGAALGGIIANLTCATLGLPSAATLILTSASSQGAGLAAYEAWRRSNLRRLQRRLEECARQVLGLRRNFTSSSLSKRWRILARYSHPDKNSSRDAQRRFELFTHCREVLKAALDRAERGEGNLDEDEPLWAKYLDFSRLCSSFDWAPQEIPSQAAIEHALECPAAVAEQML